MKFFRYLINRKAAKKLHSDTMSILAVRPAALNISLLLDPAKQTVREYLLASYKLKTEQLPTFSMEEKFYYDTINKINNHIINGVSREIYKLEILNFNMKDYDNSVMYAIRSISYTTTFLVEGIIHNNYGNTTFKDTIKTTVVFINDSRVGWLLSNETKI